MKTLVIVLALLIPALASADNACPAKGTPLFEIDHKADARAHLATNAIKIYESGAWTFQPIDADGKAGTLSRGCFDKATVADIRGALKAAPWKVTPNRIVCMAYSPKFTTYSVHGKLKFTQRMCGKESLDETSLASIKKIEGILDPVVPKG